VNFSHDLNCKYFNRKWAIWCVSFYLNS